MLLANLRAKKRFPVGSVEACRERREVFYAGVHLVPVNAANTEL